MRMVDGKTIFENEFYRYLSTQPMMRILGEQPTPTTLSDKTVATYTLPDAAILKGILQRFVSLQKRKFTRLPETEEYKLIFGLDHLAAVFSNEVKVGDQSEKSTATLALIDGPERRHLDLDDNEKADRSNSALTSVLDESQTRVSAKDIWTMGANRETLSLKDIVHVYKGSNSSATGYCLTYSHTNSSKIKVGDLAGVYEKESKISTGLICWLEYSHDGVLSFGIKLLSPEAKAVRIGFLENPDIAYTETALSKIANTNALLLSAIPAAKKPISLLAPPLAYKVGNWVVLKTNHENKVYRLERLLDSTTAVNHFELFELSDNVR